MSYSVLYRCYGAQTLIESKLRVPDDASSPRSWIYGVMQLLGSAPVLATIFLLGHWEGIGIIPALFVGGLFGAVLGLVQPIYSSKANNHDNAMLDSHSRWEVRLGYRWWLVPVTIPYFVVVSGWWLQSGRTVSTDPLAGLFFPGILGGFFVYLVVSGVEYIQVVLIGRH